MKLMKYIYVYIYLFFVFNHNGHMIREVNAIESKTWCWTKPIYDISDLNNNNIYNDNNYGGINWGICKQLTPLHKNNYLKKEYTIYISTSSLPNSEAHGIITISLIGSEETSKEIELTSSGFKSGAFDKIRIFAEDVGDIYAIRLTAKNRLQWRCNTIRIESYMNFWDFECDKALSWPSSMIELTVVNLIEYTIIVKVNAIEDSGTSLPVYIRIYGTKTQTPFKLLSNNGFMYGSVITKTIKTIDVGDIDKIALIINGHDDLLINEIIIYKHNENEYNTITPNTISSLSNTKISKETIFININNTPLIGLTPLILLPSNTNHISSPAITVPHLTSILSNTDKHSIIKLTCYDVLKDNDNFGPLYHNNNVNYQNYIIECPYNCLHRPNTFIPVYGIGVHPEESPICLSAIIDNACSIYGGIISLNVQNGLMSYTGSISKYGMHVSSYASSKRSYTVSKVDNVDLIESDVRILNEEGMLSNEGRIEVRLNGKWSAICGVSKNIHGDATARVACRQLGYDSGYVINESNGDSYRENYCSNYNGSNYCGVKGSYVMFANVHCLGNEVNVLDCERQYAATITQCMNNEHSYDLLIHCDMNSNNNNNNNNNYYKQNTLRLIGFDNKISTNGIGRVEILRTSWGTLCNSNSNNNNIIKYKRQNNKIGNIICKQMGYITGTVYDKCTNIEGSNLCGSITTPITLSNILCKGHENKIHHCKHSDITVDCLHTNDIVVKCIGYGDGSGLNQNPTNIKPNLNIIPYHHKLPMQPIFSANCETTLKHIYFRGDPGSIYMITCPMNCHKTKYAVYGNGIYAMHSSICRSAIHSGAVSSKGGDVVLVKTYGQNYYYSNTIRNVDSMEHSVTSVSFFFTQVNSGYYYLVELFNKKNSFIEMYSKLNSVVTKDIKATFEWIPLVNEGKFSNKGFVDLRKVDNYKKVFELKVFTIYMKVKMNSIYNDDNDKDVLVLSNNNNKQTIFSIGGCEGFSININSNNEIVFDVKCSSKIYGSTIYMPVNSFIICAIVYDGMKLNFYLNNKKLYETNVNLYLHYSTLTKITLGKSSEYDLDYFNGDIKYIAIFNEALPLTSIQYIYVNGYIHPDKMKNIKSYTSDNRECISPCYNLPIPGYPGSPNPPYEAIDISLNKKENNTMIVPFIEVKCTMSARDLGLNIGDTVRVKCIDDCSLDMMRNMEREYKKKSVVGSLIYNIDSLICYSAIHSGVLSYAKMNSNNNNTNSNNNSINDIVIVHILAPLQYYHSSFQYNIQSVSYNNSLHLNSNSLNEYSFSFEHSPPIPLITCQTTISSNISLFNSTLMNVKYQVACPSKCAKHQQHVYGDILYSGDSSICQSAIHAGAITDKGGPVIFTITTGLNHYPSKRSFHIFSKEHNSHINSIQFHNTNYKLTTPYIETCTTMNLNTNWDFIDDIQGDHYQSQFHCKTNPTTHSHIKNKLTSYIIKPHTKITSYLSLHYGTLMLLKNTDIVNTLFQISFYFNSINPVAIIFRYKDIHNFFHLRLCDNNNKLVLYKKIDGKDSIIGEYDISLIPKIWYTFQLQIYYEEIRVLMCIGNSRRYVSVIYVKDNCELQRGRIGVGVDGNDDVYVNNIYISDYNGTSYEKKDKDNKMFVFDTIIKYNTLKTKDKYCKALYERQGINVNECKEMHKYCKLRCDELVHRRENILNYSCYKSCIEDTMQREKKVNIKQIN